MGIILNLLEKDPIGNHSRAISDVLPKVMLDCNQQLDGYLASRIQSTMMLSRINRGKLKVIEWTDSSLVAAHQWPDLNEVKNGLLENEDKSGN